MNYTDNEDIIFSRISSLCDIYEKSHAI